MTRTVCNVEHQITSQTQTEKLPGWQAQFLVRKLAPKRGEHVVIMGHADKVVIDMLLAVVGTKGRVTVLSLPQRHETADAQDHNEERVHIAVPGPSQQLQNCDVILLMPERLIEPFHPLIDQAWRRLGNGGRLMLMLEPHNGEMLNGAVAASTDIGFVQRYRRNCDSYCAWVGVKYQRG